MKIDKIIFSCSPSAEYAPFWDLQAKIWATRFGIQPICLLFGKKSEVSMSEEYGQVIECVPVPNLPWSLQMVWSKFCYPVGEPDTTWIVGDIDLLPLQRSHFVEKIAGVPDTAYIHLNAGGISVPRLGCPNGFLANGPERLLRDQGICGGADLPGHYHVAKGRQFELFSQGKPYWEVARHIYESDRYGIGVMTSEPKENREKNPYWYFWCAEENYSSELMFNAIQAGKLDFVPFYYDNGNGRDRINREVFPYDYSREKLAAQGYVDIHCARPYDRQADQLLDIVKTAWSL